MSTRQVRRGGEETISGTGNQRARLGRRSRSSPPCRKARPRPRSWAPRSPPAPPGTCTPRVPSAVSARGVCGAADLKMNQMIAGRVGAACATGLGSICPLRLPCPAGRQGPQSKPGNPHNGLPKYNWANDERKPAWPAGNLKNKDWRCVLHGVAKAAHGVLLAFHDEIARLQASRPATKRTRHCGGAAPGSTRARMVCDFGTAVCLYSSLLKSNSDSFDWKQIKCVRSFDGR